MVNIDNIYEVFLNRNVITTKELLELGCSKYDINSLIDRNILTREKRGIYKLGSVEEFYHYGVRCTANDKEKAIKVFNKCIDIDLNYTSSYFQLFLTSISSEEYEDAYKYLKILLNNTNNTNYTNYTNDHYIYLYLLSFVMKLDKEDIDFIKTIEINDVYVQEDDKRFSNIDNQNNIRYYILNNYFSTALHNIYKDNKENNSGSTCNYAFTKFLKQIIKHEKETNRIILELLEVNDVESVKRILQSESDKHRLSYHDDAVLEICNSIIYMNNNNAVPEIIEYKSDFNDVYKYIYRKDYKKALELQKSISSEDTILSKILEIAIRKSDEIMSENNKSINYVSLVNSLLEGNYDEYFMNLEKFLEARGKEQYKHIFADLIKISLLEKDELYVLPIDYLSQIQKERFSFDIGIFLEGFYECVRNNNVEIAKIYLDIIKKSDDLYTDKINIELLEKYMNSKTNKTINTKMIKEEKRNEDTPIENNTNTSVIIENNQENKNIETKPTIKEQQDKKYALKHLRKKLKEINPKAPFILLNPLDRKISDCLIEEINKTSNVLCTKLEIESKERILLKYHIEAEDDINFKTLCRKAQKFNNKKEYNKCLKLYKEIICKSDIPKRFVISNMGRLYLRYGDLDTALMYFEISDAIARLKGKEEQHEEMIFLLKNEIPDEEQKHIYGIKFDICDFYDDMNDHYQIEDYEDIFSLIDTGLTIEEACHEFDLTDEDISIIKLVTARNYYSQKNFKAGDKVFKQVERSKNKTPFIKSLMEEIRTNKKLYPYRNCNKEYIKA